MASAADKGRAHPHSETECTGPSRNRLFTNRLGQAGSSGGQKEEDRYLLQFIRSQFLRAQKHMFLDGDMYSSALALRQAACAAGFHRILGQGLEAAVPVWQRRFAGTEGNHLLSTFLRFSKTGRETNQLARRTLQFGPSWNQGPLELQGSTEINGVLAFALANSPTRFPVWVPGEHENEVFGQDWLWDRLRQEFVYPLLFDGGAAQPGQTSNLATRPSRKMLLYGPQGCGKKFLARAAAGMFIEPKKNLAAEVSVCDRESPTRNLAVSLSCSFLVNSQQTKNIDLAKQFIRAAEKIAARLDAWALGRGEEEGVPARTCFFLEDTHCFEKLDDKGLEYFLLTSIVSSLAQKFPRVVFICTSNRAPQPWMLDSSLFDSAFFVDFPSRERMAHVVIDTVISTLAPMVASGQPLSRLCKFKKGLLQNVRLHNFALRLADTLTVDETTFEDVFLTELKKNHGYFSREGQLFYKRFKLLQLQRGLDIPQELAAYFWERGNLGALEPETHSVKKRPSRQTSWPTGSVVFAKKKKSKDFVEATVVTGLRVTTVKGEREQFDAEFILGHEEFSDMLSSRQALETAHGFMNDSVLDLDNFLKLLLIQIEQNYRQNKKNLVDKDAKEKNLGIFYGQFLDWIWRMALKFYRKRQNLSDKDIGKETNIDERKKFFTKVEQEKQKFNNASKTSKKSTFFLKSLFEDLERGRLYLLQQKTIENIQLATDFNFSGEKTTDQPADENESLLLGTPSTNPTLNLASQTGNYFEHIMKKVPKPLENDFFDNVCVDGAKIDLDADEQKNFFKLTTEQFLGTEESHQEIEIEYYDKKNAAKKITETKQKTEIFFNGILPTINKFSTSGADKQGVWPNLQSTSSILEQRLEELFVKLESQRRKEKTNIMTVIELETSVRKGVNDFLMERLEAELGVVNGRDLSDKVVQQISRNILNSVFNVDIASLLLNSTEKFASPFARNEEGSLRSLENLTSEIAASRNLGPEGERNAREAGQLLADIRKTRRKQGSTESLFQQRQDVAIDVLATSRALLDSKLCCCVLEKVIQDSQNNNNFDSFLKNFVFF